MTNESRPNPRFYEDLHFERSDGPADYAYWTDKPVQYVHVVGADDKVLGFLWANDEDDAAGWTPRAAMGAAAAHGAFWRARFQESWVRRLAPTAVLDEAVRGAMPEGAATVGWRMERPTLRELQHWATLPSDPRGLPRVTEDLPFEEAAGGPPRYQRETGGPVQYLTVVAAGGEVVGYVWASDQDDAAGWLVRKSGGPAAFNEGILWATLLHDAKARGIPPSAALAEMIRSSTAGGDGRVVSGSLTEAPNVEALRSLAREG